MGTRGLIKLVCKNVIIYIYNHFDSYPSYLGTNLIKDIKLIFECYGIEWLINKISLLHIVNDDDVIDDAIIDKLRPYTDLEVGTESTTDWYCLLRNTQGSLINILDAGYVQAFHYVGGDCFIEYIYEINVDTNTFSIITPEVFELPVKLDNIPDNLIELYENIIIY